MKCTCGKVAVYFRVNEGRHYCASCLTRQIERNFTRTVSKENMIKKGDKVAVGVSGGKDSMVLLHLMNKLRKKVPIKIFAITIDEGIKGYRNKSMVVVTDLTKTLEIEHHVFSFKGEIGASLDELKESKFCTKCGVFRRYLLNKKSRELGASKLAVGHNLDDEAQSIMMNVMRGDVDRIKRKSSSNKFVPRIKPLKNIPEKEMVAYAVVNNIPYFEGECPYSFDNVRRDVQAIINEMESKHPGTKNQIVRFGQKVTFVKDSRDIKDCLKCGEPSSQEVCKACQLLEKIKKI